MAAAATKLFSLLETNATVTATAAANLYLFCAIRLPILRFRRYSSSSASVIAYEHTRPADDVGEATGDSQKHPWPEWLTFVDRLKAKGYINYEGGSDVALYKDMSILKDACLSFGRDRFDLFKSLSMQDIQTLVEKGCPNINRKTVNSGKRLRAHLQLDEEDACGVCVLRGSCDMAYVTLKDVESAARTVDIVRILLNYALDPVVGLSKKPLGADVVEASAKKLLLELTELSETRVDPELQKPAASVAQKAPSFELREQDSSRNVEMKRGDWMCPKCNFLNFARNKKCRECNEDGPKKSGDENVEMKTGDWICLWCNFKNFARNEKCRECNEDGPQKFGDENVEMKKGDWICPQCNFMNFSINIRCLKCKTEGRKRVATDDIKMRKGDWNCPQCNFLNYARNKKCRECNEDGPQKSGDENVEMKKGDWICPQCNFMNFSRNIRCLKCKTERPKRVATDDIKMRKGVWNCPQCRFMNFASNTKCLRCREHRPSDTVGPSIHESGPAEEVGPSGRPVRTIKRPSRFLT